jgi:hypothetical protein
MNTAKYLEVIHTSPSSGLYRLVNEITYKIHPENGKKFSEKIYGDRRYVNIR